jgi:probable F420-dependent oxidoreductase
MKIGIATSISDQSLPAGTVARLVEEAGFETLSFGEHSHIPAARQTPYPGGDGDLPPGYERLLDLVVSLTCAALATETIRLATGIMQIVQRDPIWAAKSVATLDRVSNGRMLLITGSSWNIEEMRNHGVDPETRYDLVRERMLAMREIWRDDEATFHGDFVNFDRIWSWPKPVQPGGVPLFLGGNSPGSEDRALEYGSGWAPIVMPGVVERVKAFTDAHDLPVIPFGVATDPKDVEEYAAAGAHRIVMGLGPAQPGEIERSLEELRACVATAVG